MRKRRREKTFQFNDMMTHHLQNIAQSSKTAFAFFGWEVPTPQFLHLFLPTFQSKVEKVKKKNKQKKHRREREREREKGDTQNTRARAHKKRSKRWEKKKELCANPRVILLLLFERARVFSD